MKINFDIEINNPFVDRIAQRMAKAFAKRAMKKAASAAKKEND